MRLIVMCLAAAVLAGCDTSVPDSGAEATGVGFGNYQTYQQQREAREAALAGQTAGQTTGAPLSALAISNEPQTEAQALAAQTRAALGRPVATAAAVPPATAPVAAAPVAAAPVQTAAAPVAAAPVARVPGGLSDEQNFEAVAARETIASDRERLQEQRSQFEQVQPSALPTRPAGSETNIVAFALATSHPPGTKLYSRTNLFGLRDGRNCNRYSNANEAQEAFLANGGPQQDKQGLDPDGDGYACGWDPSPFRLAAQSRAAGN